MTSQVSEYPPQYNRYKICTSVTRPSQPVFGEMIYETDTDKLLIYHNDTVEWQPPWNLPWGVVYEAASSTRFNNVTTASDIHSNLAHTFTAVAGRRYRISGHVYLDFRPASPANCYLYVYKDNVQLNNISARSEQSSGIYLDTYTGWLVDEPGAGSVKYSLRASSSDNPDVRGDLVTSRFMIEDIGPA